VVKDDGKREKYRGEKETSQEGTEYKKKGTIINWDGKLAALEVKKKNVREGGTKVSKESQRSKDVSGRVRPLFRRHLLKISSKDRSGGKVKRHRDHRGT